MELEGPVALVTGASRRIGKGIALSMAEAGADVVVNYQSNKDGAEQTASEVRAKGRNAMLVQADVKDLSSVKAMVDQAVKVLGKVDILVNNAGIYSAKSFTADDAIETFRDIMETHVFGSLYCTQAVLPSMRAQQRGDIIFITSLAGKQFWAEEWAYATAKNAMSTLVRHSPDRTTFPGYSSRRDAANYNLAFQGRQMRPDSLKFLLSWTNHRPAKRKISKPLVYDQVSSLGSPFALYDPVTVINPDAPKVD